MKKIISSIILVFSILTINLNVFAANTETELEVIQKESKTQYLENDQGNITKKIVDYDKENGDVTIEIKVSNVKKDSQENENYEDTEIYLIVDEGLSYYEEKLNQYIDYIKKFANNVLKRNSKTKIGIIGIKGTIHDAEIGEDGKMVIGENDEGDVKGTEQNTEIVCNLTNNVETLEKSLKNMNIDKTRYSRNLEATIKLANKSYSNKVNKILISLYDEVPDIAIGVKLRVNYGGIWGNTIEEAVNSKYKEVSQRTREEILKLEKNNIKFIQLRPEDTSYDTKYYDNKTGEKILDFDGSKYVQNIYGTLEKPLYGKMYTLKNETIDKIISENIYSDVMQIVTSNITNVIVKDYFPKNIINYFDFSYVDKPNIGSVTDKINNNTNAIEWNIGTLEENKVAVLKYKLKIKNMKNKELLDKVIATNEKVEVTYKDYELKEYIVQLTDSPKVKLSAIKQEENKTNNVNDNNKENNTIDTTIASGEIPQTGARIEAIIIIAFVIMIILFTYLKIKKYKDVK